MSRISISLFRSNAVPWAGTALHYCKPLVLTQLLALGPICFPVSEAIAAWFFAKEDEQHGGLIRSWA